MITITLENKDELDKTHFADIEELFAYLNKRLKSQYPHENPEFMNVLQERSKGFKENTSSALDFKKTLESIRIREK